MATTSQKRRFKKQVEDFEGIIIYPEMDSSKTKLIGAKVIKSITPAEFVRSIIIAMRESKGFTGYRTVNDINKIIIMTTSKGAIQYYTTTDIPRNGDNHFIKSAFHISRWLRNSYGLEANVDCGEYTCAIEFENNQSLMIGFNQPNDKSKERTWTINSKLDSNLEEFFNIDSLVFDKVEVQ